VVPATLVISLFTVAVFLSGATISVIAVIVAGVTPGPAAG
jgi:hypothetical protein